MSATISQNYNGYIIVVSVCLATNFLTRIKHIHICPSKGIPVMPVFLNANTRVSFASSEYAFRAGIVHAQTVIENLALV